MTKSYTAPSAKYVLAIDPSGAFYEGKGTTGYCLLNCNTKCIAEIGDINASRYKTDTIYWNEHVDLLSTIVAAYPNLVVVIEDYFLYATKAKAQINSKFETCQLIGILKYWCYINKVPYRMQSASAVKTRWPDHILEHKHYLKSFGTSYVLLNDTPVNRHMRDALRHAVHYAVFGGNDETKN
jgi:hypothetical protein